MPVNVISRTRPATAGVSQGSVSRTVSADTGRTGSDSRASHFPFCKPETVANDWSTVAGTSSSDASHLKIRRTRATRLLMTLRQRSASIIFWRTAFNASGPNSRAGV
jgi:hypothetical protein